MATHSMSSYGLSIAIPICLASLWVSSSAICFGQNPTANSAPKQSQLSRYERYVDGLMNRYDINEDGRLDQEEMKSVRRPPRNIDADKDGFVTRKEYLEAVSGMPSQSRAATASQRSEPKQNSSRIGKEVQLRVGLVSMKSNDAQMQKLVQAKVNFETFQAALASLAKDDVIELHDVISVPAIHDKRTSIQSGGTTPVRVGVTTSRSGQKIYNTRDVNTGLKLIATPFVEGDQIQMEISLDKSYVEQVGDETEEQLPSTSVMTIQFDSSVVCQNGKIKMVQCQQGNKHWILLVGASTKIEATAQRQAKSAEALQKQMQQQLIEAMRRRAGGSTRDNRGGSRSGGR